MAGWRGDSLQNKIIHQLTASWTRKIKLLRNFDELPPSLDGSPYVSTLFGVCVCKRLYFLDLSRISLGVCILIQNKYSHSMLSFPEQGTETQHWNEKLIYSFLPVHKFLRQKLGDTPYTAPSSWTFPNYPKITLTSQGRQKRVHLRMAWSW